MIKITHRRKGFYSLSCMILYVWAGMIIGISFLEAPLKFQAPNITLALGLGIGRLVFGALNKIEIFFALCLVGIAFFNKVSSHFWILYSLVLLLLLVQSLWLLPMLDERAAIIINGGISDESTLHLFYVSGDLMKLFLLITLGVRIYSESLKEVGGSYD